MRKTQIAWLGRQDSNLGMAVPKTAALPLGDAPTGAVPTRFASASQHGPTLWNGRADLRCCAENRHETGRSDAIVVS